MKDEEQASDPSSRWDRSSLRVCDSRYALVEGDVLESEPVGEAVGLIFLREGLVLQLERASPLDRKKLTQQADETSVVR